MAYRVNLTERAGRNLGRIYETIDAAGSAHARRWFAALERTVFSLDENPARGAAVAEDGALRQLLHGRKRHVYRIIYAIEESDRIVTVLHIRHAARAAFEFDADEA